MRRERGSRRGAARREQGGRPEPRSADRRALVARGGSGKERGDARGAPSTKPSAHTSPRVPIARGEPRLGDWLFTSREDATNDLADELRLALGSRGAIQIVEPALVRSRFAPTFEDGTLDLTFARQGIPVLARLPSDPRVIAPRVVELVGDASAALKGRLRLEAWAPDSESGNRRMPASATLLEAVRGELARLAPALAERLAAADERAADVASLVSLVSLADGSTALGAQRLLDALSPFPGGRARMRVGADRPSRATRKLEEALHWFGLAPGAGERCVDLGAAPGGWSWALIERRARVVAVDPALLRPDLMRQRNLRHAQTSAFAFEPEEPVDWLFCDMAWRPLEVAELLAKWGRRRWARFVVANLKLPMKEKARIVAELRAIVHGGGFTRIRTRQLYHDRDEITLLAVR